MGWIGWVAVFYFGTMLFTLVGSMINLFKFRARATLGDQAVLQIRLAVFEGIDYWLCQGDDDESQWIGRLDTLPLKFKDLDDLSEQL